MNSARVHVQFRQVIASAAASDDEMANLEIFVMDVLTGITGEGW